MKIFAYLDILMQHLEPTFGTVFRNLKFNPYMFNQIRHVLNLLMAIFDSDK